MRTPLVLLVCLLALTACEPPPRMVGPEPTSPTVADTALSERRVAYVLDVTLDPDARTVAGTAQITWRNPDRVPVDTLQFHLYLNAFRDSLSTFMRESGGSHRGFRPGEDGWGGIDIEALRLSDGTDLTDALRFIQTTSANPDDRTVAEVVLPEPVAPQESITLNVAFTSRMPRIFARTGWATAATGEPFFMVAQWFPKLGVREIPGQRYVPADAPRGAWRTHQFHQNTEFYADFGTYRVTMRVPAGYKVGATGIREHEQEDGSTRTLTYYAADVHDFAWTASPAFEVYEDAWEHVRLRLLVQPEHAAQAQRHFDAAKHALARYAEWVGPYPYTTLTLVDGIGGSNGMEYPTLITCGTVYALPRWARPLELVTIHEFGHQYFYGLLASNEAEEAWLDEGFNSYFEARIMDDAYGAGSVLDLPGFKISDEEFQRISYLTSDAGVIAKPAYKQTRNYGTLTYSKPATILLSLQRYLGEETMNRIMRTYYERWRFRHPTTQDFIAVAEEVAGEDLSWFFYFYVYGSTGVNYALDRVDTDVRSSGGFTSTAVVVQKSDGVFPVQVAFDFADGTTETRALMLPADTTRVEVTHTAALLRARLYPDGLPLDSNPLDDRWVAEPGRAFSHKMDIKSIAWVQQLFYLAAGF